MLRLYGDFKQHTGQSVESSKAQNVPSTVHASSRMNSDSLMYSGMLIFRRGRVSVIVPLELMNAKMKLSKQWRDRIASIP